MAGSLRCILTTPEEKVYEGKVRFVVVPASDGELGILPRHAPLIGNLGCGELRIDVEGEGKVPFFVDGGFLQVLDDSVSVLAARAIPAGSLNEAEEEANLRNVEAEKPGVGASSEEREEYARSVASAKARLRLARKSL